MIPSELDYFVRAHTCAIESHVFSKAKMETLKIPMTFIDSSYIPTNNKKIWKTDLTEATMLELGLPPLPKEDGKSVYIQTVDVPKAWFDLVSDALIGIIPEKDEILFRFAILIKGFNWKTVHYMIYLIRTRKTNDSYHTQGSITNFDEKLVRSDIKWVTKNHYKEILKKISLFTGDDLSEMLQVDMSLRYKRSKVDCNTITTKEGRSFCFMSYINDKNQRESRWIDISLSNDLPQSSMSDKKPSYSGDKCNINECSIITNLSRCARCKKVYYCTREHQQKDWSSHKKICSVLS